MEMIEVILYISKTESSQLYETLSNTSLESMLAIIELLLLRQCCTIMSNWSLHPLRLTLQRLVLNVFCSRKVYILSGNIDRKTIIGGVEACYWLIIFRIFLSWGSVCCYFDHNVSYSFWALFILGSGWNHLAMQEIASVFCQSSNWK